MAWAAGQRLEQLRIGLLYLVQGVVLEVSWVSRYTKEFWLYLRVPQGHLKWIQLPANIIACFSKAGNPRCS